MGGIELLVGARAAGLTVQAVGDRLEISGPPSAGAQAQLLLKNKAAVLRALYEHWHREEAERVCEEANRIRDQLGYSASPDLQRRQREAAFTIDDRYEEKDMPGVRMAVAEFLGLLALGDSRAGRDPELRPGAMREKSAA